MTTIEPMEAKLAETLPEGAGWQSSVPVHYGAVGEEARAAIVDPALAGD